MTTRTWIGIGTIGADWFATLPVPWSPPPTPQSGDQVIIADGGPSISNTDPSVDNVQIALGSDEFPSPAQLVSNGGTIGAGAAIAVSREFPYALLDLQPNGAANSVFNGTANVAGGQLNLTIGSGLTGNGTVTVAQGGNVTLTGTVASGPSFAFLDDNGTLGLTDPATFAGTITGLQTGHRIQLGHRVIVESTEYDTSTSQLTLFGQNHTFIATLNVTLQGGGPVTFFASPDGHGASVVTTSQTARIWGGGTARNWFDAANWNNGVPLGGDTASILSGSAIVGETDANTHGVMDYETVYLGAAGGFTPVTLNETGVSFGSEFNLTALGTPQYGSTYIVPQATLVANGITRFGGNLSAMSHGGTLTVDIEANGTNANFVLIGDPGTADANTFAEAFAGQESTLIFTGTGTLTNNGRVLIDGVGQIGGGVIVQGGGSIEIQAGGSVSISGAVESLQSVVFSDETGSLKLNDLSTFLGHVELFGAVGDEIDVAGIQAASLSYDGSTDMLSLLNSGGQSLGAFKVTSNLDLAADDFVLTSDGSGGSLLTYTPQTPPTLRESLPIAAVGTTAAVIPLSTLLTQAFGAVPAYTEYFLSGPEELMKNESYWQQKTSELTNSAWLFDGNPISQQTHVDAKDIDHYSFLVGNSIPNTAFFTVPNATIGGVISQYIQYNVWTVNPAVNAPVTAYPTPDPAIPGSGTRFGELIASDIVASALRYNNVYNGVINFNNCNWIADNVTAGAGAVMPYQNASTDPTDNQEGGFWRIVYRGSDVPSPVANWFPLTEPGDVVRMGRIDGGGQHTTTVIGTVNPDGTITVYDNGDSNAAGMNIIGIHNPTYWTGTDPASITIYRLDPNQQYLITGSGLTEYLQGSVYNDLIRPAGGTDTIVGGPGNNEVQGTTAQIDGISFSDFALGDQLDLTDLAPNSVTGAYNAVSGVLDIEQNSSVVATVVLPTGLTDRFLFSADGAGGTSITLACFAEGTRIATPDGNVPVQYLSEGTLVLTADGEALPVVWLGHRHVDCARHPCPEQVSPVRVAAGAFGRGLPARHLLLSPGHAVFVDDVLIPVKYLVNGGRIAQVAVAEVPEVTYWHLELPRHAVVLAEKLPVESYLDTGDRANFANGGVLINAIPDFSNRVWEAYGCAPLCVTGPVLDAVRSRLRCNHDQNGLPSELARQASARSAKSK